MGKDYKKHGNWNSRNKTFSQFGHKKNKDEKFGKEAKTDQEDRNYRNIENLSENEVGITEYIGNWSGFTGIIKAKFSDFHVNEIDLDGNLVKLTDLSIPEPPTNSASNNTPSEESQTNECIQNNIVSEIVWNEIKGLIENENSDSSKSIEIDVTELDKVQRTLIHTTLKNTFNKSVISSTIERDSRKYIKCTKFSKNVSQDNRFKWLWPHEYTYFVLHKVNIDTMKAVSMLASHLSCKPSSLAYAGTKDKRAKTSQWCCIKKREPARIVKAADRIPNVHVGNFTWRPTTLKLGQLKGNRFRIVLRHITADKELVEKSLTSVKNKGFINYYGLQRFGNCASVPTYSVGKALLKGQWKEACELILKPRPGDPNYMKKMREYWWKTRDAKGALRMLHASNKSLESKLLTGMAKHGPNDFVNALENIPRNMRLLYIHSYQSLIWNQIASKRTRDGLSLQPGDLVFVDDKSNSNCLLEAPIDEDIDSLIESVEQNDDKAQPADSEIEPSSNEENLSPYKALVRPLTEADIQSGKYNIFDLVLPLPGHDISYPTNKTGDWYSELLSNDDLSSEKLKQKVKTYSLTGAYRKMLIKPENMSWYFTSYNTDDDFLINSDLEEIQNKKFMPITDGNLTALILDFCLPSSTYATMVLREILKTDTSASNQIKLNDEQEQKVVENKPMTDEANGRADKRIQEEIKEEEENLKKIKVM